MVEKRGSAMSNQESLSSYRGKRDFSRSPEPKGSVPEEQSDNRFVIQKHKASTLHYDLRIEVDGVLKSWAVPKGPSTNPADKRLAIATEDHPLEYIDFEGTIRETEYGGGTVLIWDRGTYRNLKDEPLKNALARGRVEIWIDGQKIKGGYALVRTGKRWLLIKMKDDEADARRKPVSTEPRSVESGRTIEEIAEEDGGE